MVELHESSGHPGGEHHRAAAGHGREIRDVEDPLALDTRRDAAGLRLCRGAAFGDVVVTDQARQEREELVFGKARAGDTDIGGRPELGHAVLPESLDALRPGLEERGHDDAARAVVRVHIGQLAPPADVRCFVENGHQRRREAPASPTCPDLLCGHQDRHGERSGDSPGGPAALLGDQVDRVG